MWQIPNVGRRPFAGGEVAFLKSMPELLSEWFTRHRVFLVVLFVGVALSASIAFMASKSLTKSPELEIVLYSGIPSTAQFFAPDEFGAFSESRSQSLRVKEGVNTLRFDLSDTDVQNSLIQRVDPCVCDLPILIQRVSLRTPLYFKKIPLYLWSFAGDTEGFSQEGSAVLVTTTKERADPQVIFYADIKAFIERAETVAFWALFGSLGAFTLFVVGLVGVRTTARFSWLQSRSRYQRKEGLWLPLGVGLFSSIVVGLALFQQLSGALVTGITVDEPSHVRHLTNFFETGVYSSEVYGPFTALLGHSLNVVLGNEVWGTPLATLEAYQGRHLAVALIGFLGLVGVGVAAWSIFGSFRWAFLAAAFLGSLPVWVGHSMFNLKDIPVATGYTLVTAGLIVGLSSQVQGWRKTTLALILVGTGTLVGAGTRPGMLALMAGSALVFAVLWLFFHKKNGSQTVKAGWLAAGSVSALMIGSAVVVFTDFGQSLVAGIERSLDFPWTGLNLYAGEMVSERPGVGTILLVFSSYMPLFILALTVVGFGFGIVKIIQSMSSREVWSIRESAFILIGAQASVGLVFLAVMNPVIYDGGRQLLFTFPAWGLLAVYGVFAALKAVPYVFSSGRWGRRIVFAVLVTGLSVITFDQIRFFPYNYSYYNEIAQGPGITGRWETDYWASSIREGAGFVAPDDPVICGAIGSHRFDIGSNLPGPCPVLSPYVGDSAPVETTLLAENQFWVIRGDRTLLNHGPIISDNCTLHHEVTRPLRGEDVVMSRVYICDDL